MDAETAKLATPFALPFVNAAVDTWIKPKLAVLAKAWQKDKQLVEHAMVSRFTEYLDRSHNRYSFMTTVVFQNQQKHLIDLYVPVTVRLLRTEDEAASFKIDEYRDTFLPTYKRVLLTETAGMGKSTVLKFLFLRCLAQNAGIPVFIELRKLSKTKNLIDWLHGELSSIDEPLDIDLLFALLRRGDFVFFFDGFDEIPFDSREAVINDLKDFISKGGQNLFIIASRPEAALVSFSDFQNFGIQPLGDTEAYDLLRKYDSGGQLSSRIITSVKEPRYAPIKEFLRNPFLVSLLYKSYEYKAVLPLRKHIFYRQVFDSLFETHDLTKDGPFVREKYSKLDSDQFHQVVRALGFASVKSGKVEYSKDELLALVSKARCSCAGLKFKEADLIRDLVLTVPLFVLDGDQYRWSHISVQEYFAASFICLDTKAAQEQLLLKLYAANESGRFNHLLDLCCDLDYKTFRRTIIYKLLSEFINYWDGLAYSNFETYSIPADHIERRKLLNFGITLEFVLLEKESRQVVFRDENGLLFTVNVLLTKPRARCPLGLRIRFTKEQNLIDILGERGENFILRKKAHPDGKFITQLTKRLLELPASRFPIPIDDSPDIPLNEPANFNKASDLLGLTGFFTMGDVQRCRRLKETIEQEWESDKEDEFIFGDL